MRPMRNARIRTTRRLRHFSGKPGRAADPAAPRGQHSTLSAVRSTQYRRLPGHCGDLANELRADRGGEGIEILRRHDERPRTADDVGAVVGVEVGRSEEHTSELQSLMRISYAVFCLKKKPHTHI